MGTDDARENWLVESFEGFDEQGRMRLVNGDFSDKCGAPRSGLVVIACGDGKGDAGDGHDKHFLEPIIRRIEF